jgi:hypothetical protein
MRKHAPIEPGQLFAAADDLRFQWRVEKALMDGVHVVLVRVDDPTRRKTVSIWALSSGRLFVPVTPPPTRQAG